jgi:predicted dehydrogenase
MKQKINRRTFLQTAGAASAAMAFHIVPRHVLGRGFVAPSEKVNVASIGVGGQGQSNLQSLQSTAANIVALCDPDPRMTAAAGRKHARAKAFTDYRRMLDEMKEIDGVVIATPDHHHAFASMEAIRRGKHVYCEKPLTHSVWESRRIAEAAREAKVATQMGNSGQASASTRLLCELVWSGAIGPVREAHIWTDRPSRGLFEEYWPQGVGRPKETPRVPEGMDWDLWVGPAPMRPYHPAYHPFAWRGWWDFGTGALGDIGCHSFDPVFRALKLGQPTSVQASCSRVNAETYPLASMVTYQFPARPAGVQANNVHVKGLSGKSAGGDEMPPVKFVWYDGGLRPPRPEGLPEGDTMGDNGRLLIGEKGFILGSGGGGRVGDRVYPVALREGLPRSPQTIPPSPGHHQEWIDACKGGNPAGSNFDWAGPLTEVVLLGNVALRSQLRQQLTQHRLDWDPAALKFTSLPEANAFVRRDYRGGWTL